MNSKVRTVTKTLSFDPRMEEAAIDRLMTGDVNDPEARARSLVARADRMAKESIGKYETIWYKPLKTQKGVVLRGTIERCVMSKVLVAGKNGIRAYWDVWLKDEKTQVVHGPLPVNKLPR